MHLFHMHGAFWEIDPLHCQFDTRKKSQVPRVTCRFDRTMSAARPEEEVEVLGLAECGIGPAGAAVLADYIFFSSALKNLDLTYNRGIEGESSRQLAAVALESKTLEVFSKVPSKELRENKLTELNLFVKGLGPAEAIVFAELASYHAIYRVRGADL